MASIYDVIGTKKKSIYDLIDKGKGLSGLAVDTPFGGLLGISFGEEAERRKNDPKFSEEARNELRALQRFRGIKEDVNLSPTKFTENLTKAVDKTFGVPDSPKGLLTGGQALRTIGRGVPGAGGFIPSAIEGIFDPESQLPEDAGFIERKKAKSLLGRAGHIGGIVLDFAKMPFDAILGIKAIIADASRDEPHILRRKVIRHLEKTLGKGFKDLEFNEKMRLIEKSIASARGRAAAPVEDRLSQLITGGTVAETEERISEQVTAAPEGIPFGLAVGAGFIRGSRVAIQFGGKLKKAFKSGKEEAQLKKIYHGTDKIFDNFDVNKSADGSIWFTDTKSKITGGEVAASGKGVIVERFINENELKLGGWEEADKFSTGELVSQGFDGLKLPDAGEITYQIFNPEKLKKVAVGSQIRINKELVSATDKTDVVAEGTIGEVIESVNDKGAVLVRHKVNGATVERLYQEIDLEPTVTLPKAKPEVEKLPIQAEKVKTPKKLYRGVKRGAAGTGKFTLGKGIYSTTDKSFAREFGKVVEVDPATAFPKNPLVLEASGNTQGAFTDWLLRESGEKRISEFNKKWKDPGDFVKSKGFDGVVIGDEVVKYTDVTQEAPKPTVEKPIKKAVSKEKIEKRETGKRFTLSKDGFFNNAGEELKIGDKVKLAFAGKPLELPTGEGTLRKATTKEVTGKERVFIDVEAPTGEILNFRADFFDPIKVESAALPKLPVVKAKPVPKPTLEKVVTKLPEKTIALNKAEITSMRKNTGLDELSKPEQRKWEKVLGEAKSAGIDKTALELTDEILDKKTTRNITDTEHAGMALKANEIMNQYEATVKSASEFADKGNKKAARLEADRAEVLLDQLDRLTRAADKAGREVARALSIRRMRLNRDNYRLAEVMQRAKASKGSKLSEKQSKKFKELTDKNKSLESQIKEIEEKFQEQQAEIEKLAATKIFNRASRRSKIKSKSEKQIKKVDKKIADAKKELAALGFRVNDITGVTAEGAFIIGKIAIAYIEKGALTLAEVVRLVFNDIPELTERDVYQSLIARDPKLQKKARSEVAKRIAQMKTQSKLLLDIEKAEKGIFDIKGKKPPEPAELKALRKTLRQLRKEAYKSAPDAGRLERALKTIDELQDQLDGGFRKVKNKKSVNEVDAVELKSAKEKIALLRKDMRVTDELSNLNEQMRTGEFEIKEKPKPKEIPVELERKLIELERVRVEIRQRIVDLGPQGVTGVAVETANTLRTLKATADMSYTLRQGFWLSTRRPIAAARSAGIAAKSFFSRYTAEQVDLALRSADHHYLRERAKLFMSELDAAKVTLREESFMSNFLEKIPVVKQIVQASNRNMVTGLNLIRTAAFDQFLRKYPNATNAELTAWADWVNVASGRGNLGKAASIANGLGFILFAPRFAWSRVQTPLRIFKHWKEPRVRKEIAKDYAATIAVGITAMTLADYAGFQVGLDPREPDFGKIRIGNTKIDIWAGVQQPVRTVIRMVLTGTDRAGLTGRHLLDREKQVSPVDLATRFATFKLSPIITTPVALITGKTVVGEKVTPSDVALEAIMPLVLGDVIDAYRDEGLRKAGLVAGFTFFGMGANTYKDSKSRTRRDIARLERQNNHAGAKIKAMQWNMDNPQNRIVTVKTIVADTVATFRVLE